MRELQRLLYPASKRMPRGRPPDSPEWYHHANLLEQAHSSIFISIYQRLRENGFAASETLVGAYRHYRSICQGSSRVTFDRAFDLTSHTDAIWVAKIPAFTVARCASCGSHHLAALGSGPSVVGNCPFCRVLQRYEKDHRVQASFPMQPIIAPGDLLMTLLAMPHYLDGLSLDPGQAGAETGWD